MTDGYQKDPAPEPPAQWTLKVKIAEYNNDAVSGKSKWKKGDMLTVQIEPHATVNMMKQRMGLIILAHPKNQKVAMNGGEALDDLTKLEDIPGLAEKRSLEVYVYLPAAPKAPPVVLSEDEGLFQGDEPDLPPSPSEEIVSKELSDAEMDKQGELKGQAQDLLEDGDVGSAVQKFTEAMMLGGVSAMMVAKRAEMLLKLKRYKAVIADATLALTLNPDSAKAFRARGKAHRFLGDYEKSAEDFSQAQKIDYDDGVADMHTYVQNRWKKIQLKKKQDAEEKQDAEAAEAS